jgi:hypothetical protein
MIRMPRLIELPHEQMAMRTLVVTAANEAFMFQVRGNI